jgi:cell division protein FtsA
VRRGRPTGLSGLADVVQSPIFATGVGLALYGARGHAGAPSAEPGEGSLALRIGRRVRKWAGDLF